MASGGGAAQILFAPRLAAGLAEVAVKDRASRVECDGAGNQFEGRLGPSGLADQRAEHMPRVGVLGRQRQHLAVGLFGLRQASCEVVLHASGKRLINVRHGNIEHKKYRSADAG